MASQGRRAVARVLPRPLRSALRRRRPGPWQPGVVLEPPTCPSGQATGPPDFVGVGAQKAGTSWWFVLLRQHPDVHVTEGNHKELHYFARFWDGSFNATHVARYHQFFPRPPGKLAGEWTPNYMAQFWTPPLLQRAAPAAKVLVMLRDPVERYRSALSHYTSRGRRVDQNLAAEAFARGLYADQLAGLQRHLHPDRLLVLQYERCVRDAESQLDRTYAFLGLRTGVRPDALQRPVNASRGVRTDLPEPVRRELRDAYAADVARLQALWPELDVSLWRHFA